MISGVSNKYDHFHGGFRTLTHEGSCLRESTRNIFLNVTTTTWTETSDESWRYCQPIGKAKKEKRSNTRKIQNKEREKNKSWLDYVLEIQATTKKKKKEPNDRGVPTSNNIKRTSTHSSTLPCQDHPPHLSTHAFLNDHHHQNLCMIQSYTRQACHSHPPVDS
jgi:hypothetical protein